MFRKGYSQKSFSGRQKPRFAGAFLVQWRQQFGGSVLAAVQAAISVSNSCGNGRQADVPVP
jgi:hypothetical protein